jgi:hypothetical protein
MGLNLIWEWRLTNRQTTVYFRSVQNQTVDWLRDIMSLQLQKLLQTYFGAMGHCLVCSLSVRATIFTASRHFAPLGSLGNSFPSPQRPPKTDD